MLSEDTKARFARSFSVYEHEWRFLAGYLGEPVESGGYLAFDDGSVINFCAFPLNQEGQALERTELERFITSAYKPESHKLIHIWGVFDPPAQLQIQDVVLDLVNQDATNEVFPGEFTIDLTTHDLATLPEAHRSVRRMHSKGLELEVTTPGALTSRHMSIIEHWRTSRAVSNMAAVAAHSLISFTKHSDVIVFDVKQDGILQGFTIGSRPNDDVAVNLMSFSKKYPGSRLGDALLWRTIEYHRDRGVKKLHLGYAGTEGLVHFKTKWGAQKTGADYRQALYAADGWWRSRAEAYDFYWMSRLLNPRSEPASLTM
jgi:hypothetical protein